MVSDHPLGPRPFSQLDPVFSPLLNTVPALFPSSLAESVYPKCISRCASWPSTDRGEARVQPDRLRRYAQHGVTNPSVVNVREYNRTLRTTSKTAHLMLGTLGGSKAARDQRCGSSENLSLPGYEESPTPAGRELPAKADEAYCFPSADDPRAS